MRKLMALLVATLFVGSQAWAACNPCNPCEPKPKMKWVTVTEEVQVQVPVKKFRMVDKEIDVCVMNKVTEQVEVKVKKQVMREKEVTTFKCEVVCEMVDKVIKKRVKVCCPVDPCASPCAKPRMTTQIVCETIQVPVKRTIKVPVTKTVQVCDFEWETKMVDVVKCVPSTEKRTIQVKECYTEMQTITKCVKKKVQVPCEPKPVACKPTCKPVCKPACKLGC